MIKTLDKLVLDNTSWMVAQSKGLQKKEKEMNQDQEPDAESKEMSTPESTSEEDSAEIIREDTITRYMKGVWDELGAESEATSSANRKAIAGAIDDVISGVVEDF